jgi:hypothetical protein
LTVEQPAGCKPALQQIENLRYECGTPLQAILRAGQ